jgi:hypothetical protein
MVNKYNVQTQTPSTVSQIRENIHNRTPAVQYVVRAIPTLDQQLKKQANL